MIPNPNEYGGFLSHKGFSKFSSIFVMGFSNQNQPSRPTSYWGTPMTMEIPMTKTQR
jgi:hypothetical protein